MTQNKDIIIEDILFVKTDYDVDKHTLYCENTSDKFFGQFRCEDKLLKDLIYCDDKLMRQQEVYLELFMLDGNQLAFYSKPFKSVRDGVYFKFNETKLLNENPNVIDDLKEIFMNEHEDEEEIYIETIDLMFGIKNKEKQKFTTLDFYKRYQEIKAEEIKKTYLSGIGLPADSFIE